MNSDPDPQSQPERRIPQTPCGRVKNLRLWLENNGKPFKGCWRWGGGGVVTGSKLKFQKIPQATQGGGWGRAGQSPVGRLLSPSPDHTDLGGPVAGHGSQDGAAPAEWTWEDGQKVLSPGLGRAGAGVTSRFGACRTGWTEILAEVAGGGCRS